ncbi:MAG: hypothetical protein ACXVBW_08485, partial [Bdellovibrionota bacterium]
MKTVMTALSLMMLSMSAAVLADDAAPILSLGDNMKKIAGLVKAIAGAVNDTSKNAASAAEADQLAAVFGAVLNQVPDSIAA